MEASRRSELCRRSLSIENGTISYKKNKVFFKPLMLASDAYFKCNDGLVLYGSQHLECHLKGVFKHSFWLGVPPSCRGIEINIITIKYIIN